jgi:hypothetical protein
MVTLVPTLQPIQLEIDWAERRSRRPSRQQAVLTAAEARDWIVDLVGEQSFPASDPPSWSGAAISPSVGRR